MFQTITIEIFKGTLLDSWLHFSKKKHISYKNFILSRILGFGIQ